MDDGERRRRPIPSDRRGDLLAGARDEAARRRPADLLTRWSTDATVGPSPVDLRTSVAFDALALDAAEAYEGVLLSPVTPLGSTSVLAPTSQDRALSTIRASEVVSDPTNVLALECGRRLRADPTAHVRLCTTHQVLRMQPAGNEPGRTLHFRLFVLADAGPGLADDGFEVAAVVSQLEAHRRILDLAGRTRDVHWNRPAAIVRSDGTSPALLERVLTAIGSAQPDVDVRTEPLVSDYYHGLRVGYGVHTANGDFAEIVDLGLFDWVAQLTSNRRHRFVASAIGIQLLAMLFTDA
ncbi:hypothetical protein EV187_3536 [Agromyces ramosus]|jgi:hypothetical protein|uniref:Uncharacterized protein n=1 Tax=Agromyces ramosus TaxID=33879 RepID=A0A4Q7M8V7_9MICO|nr:hypothetical protein [Agromyces ramosus]RZS63627.1 hypothetical protein EV187_3536 [Agromyces ramosus]